MELSDYLTPDMDSIHHSGSSRYVSPYAPQLGDRVHIRLRVSPALAADQILLRTCPDGEQQFIAMQPEEQNRETRCCWWSAWLKISMPVTSYRFMVLSRGRISWYNGSGLHGYNPTDAEDFRLLADYQSPGWLKKSVFYQIFPDRFADGDPSNNIKENEYRYLGAQARLRQWGETPTTEGREAMVEFFGGDLPGISAHLDYIADLGANALYLNPIFSAYSNHRYDVTDYFSVDPHLGGNQALAELRQALAARGMHYILDIVPNHCGRLHPWFQSAQEDPAAPTASYFTFTKHPESYETWLGVRSLPKLNYRSQALRNVMYGGQGSVFRHWLQPPYSADGWRIDVANMLARQGADQLGLEVGRGIRKAVKEENPHAYLMGENFFDATTQLQGDCWDGVMNYSGFTTPLMGWLSEASIQAFGQSQTIQPGSRSTTEAMVQSWTAFRAAIPGAVASQQFNLLGSHDTTRALARVHGNRNLLKLAAAILFTYPGVPCIYYGDEIGLGNGNGTYSRQCMSWDRSSWDMDLLEWFRSLARLRCSSNALAEGGFQVLLTEPDTLIYQRDTDDEIVLVAAHRGEQVREASPVRVSQGAIPDGLEFTERFTGQRIRVENGRLPLPAVAQGAQVWVAGFSKK